LGQKRVVFYHAKKGWEKRKGKKRMRLIGWGMGEESKRKRTSLTFNRISKVEVGLNGHKKKAGRGEGVLSQDPVTD